MISAVGPHNVIGKDNKLLWDIPADKDHFKRYIKGVVAVVGHNTYNSMPSYIFETTKQILLASGDIDLDIQQLSFINSDVVVIGGAKTYTKFMPYASKLVITDVYGYFVGDAYFPDIVISPGHWKQPTILQERTTDKKSGIQYRVVEYYRDNDSPLKTI